MAASRYRKSPRFLAVLSDFERFLCEFWPDFAGRSQTANSEVAWGSALLLNAQPRIPTNLFQPAQLNQGTLWT
jgi:hypothetical protein